MVKRKDAYLAQIDGHFYPFDEMLGDIHITHSTFDRSLVPHRHDFVEILCITEGEGVHRIGEVEFNVRRGDLFLIDKGVSHSFSAKNDSLCWINCIFRPERVKDGAKTAAEIFYSNKDGTAEEGAKGLVVNLKSTNDDIVAIFTDMLKEYDKKALGYKKILASYLEILLEKIQRRLLVDEASKKAKKNPLFDEIISNIEAAPQENYKEKELAKKSFMSPAAFSAGFKRYAGVSFSSYLSAMRIRRAILLLTYEDIPISQVQIQCGYEDTKSFYRAFRRYTGTTPANFRNKH